MASEETGKNLQYWSDAIKGLPRIPDALIDELASRPGMDAALRHLVGETTAFVRSEAAFQAHFYDTGTYFLGFLILYLHLTGGLTHRRLTALCGTSRVLSNGRASAILLRLWSKNMLRRAEHRAADRTVLYTPTPAMIAGYRARLKIDLESVAMCEPTIGALLARWEEPGMFEGLIATAGGDLVHAAVTPTADVDVFNRVGANRAAMLVLGAVILGADKGGAFPPQGETRISISALAMGFKVWPDRARRGRGHGRPAARAISRLSPLLRHRLRRLSELRSPLVGRIGTRAT